MKARVVAVSMAFLLLASATAGVAAADQGGRWAESPAGLVDSAPAGLHSLLPGDQLTPIGPAQGWYMPFWGGANGSNYLGEGGWRTYGPNYGPFGPYPDPQTAAFFGATQSPLDPFTTQLLSGFQQGGNVGGLGALAGTGQLATINRTGLAPFLGLNLNRLVGFGLGSLGTNAAGFPTFALGGQNFILPNSQAAGNVSLAALLNAGIPTNFFLPQGGTVFGTGR
jgi:hypothetical protein